MPAPPLELIVPGDSGLFARHGGGKLVLLTLKGRGFKGLDSLDGRVVPKHRVQCDMPSNKTCNGLRNAHQDDGVRSAEEAPKPKTQNPKS